MIINHKDVDTNISFLATYATWNHSRDFFLVNKTAIESNRLFIRITTYIWDNGYLQALIFFYIRQHGAYNFILYCTTTFRSVLNIFS